MKTLNQAKTAEEYLDILTNQLQANSLDERSAGSIVAHNISADFGSGVTKDNSGGLAFTLNKPADVNIDPYDSKTPNEIIIRQYIDPTLLEDSNFKKILPQVALGMIKQLNKELGYDESTLVFGHYGTFKMPGSDSCLKYLDLAGTTEIRLHSACVKVEDFIK